MHSISRPGTNRTSKVVPATGTSSDGVKGCLVVVAVAAVIVYLLVAAVHGCAGGNDGKRSSSTTESTQTTDMSSEPSYGICTSPYPSPGCQPVGQDGLSQTFDAWGTDIASAYRIGDKYEIHTSYYANPVDGSADPAAFDNAQSICTNALEDLDAAGVRDGYVTVFSSGAADSTLPLAVGSGPGVACTTMSPSG